MSTKNKSPSLSVTYSGYNECNFDPQASRRFPLWSVHPHDEKSTRMPVSSSRPTKINGLVSSGTCRTLWSTKVEPPGRLSSIVPMPMMAQCWELPTRTQSEFWVVETMIGPFKMNSTEEPTMEVASTKFTSPLMLPLCSIFLVFLFFSLRAWHSASICP